MIECSKRQARDKRKMQIYWVMLEGIDAGLGFFMNIEVAASNPTLAVD